MIKSFLLRSLFLTCLFNVTACVHAQGNSDISDPRYRMNGELIIQIFPNGEMFGVEMFADTIGKPFYYKANPTGKMLTKMWFPAGRVPQEIRVVWRKTDTTAKNKNGSLRYSGEVAGDYTIPIVTRIPEAVLEDVRQNGGELRIKLRVKPDGAMVAWDIQREGKGDSFFDYFMAGGDFSTRY